MKIAENYTFQIDFSSYVPEEPCLPELLQRSEVTKTCLRDPDHDLIMI